MGMMKRYWVKLKGTGKAITGGWIRGKKREEMDWG